jgi:hypothetical protein
VNNPFRLFSDKPGAEEASREIMGALQNVWDTCHKHRHLGAMDTASWDAMITYLGPRNLRPSLDDA